MKQYVLDEPGVAAPADAIAAVAPASRRWRWPIVFAGVGALGLVAMQLWQSDRPSTVARAAEATTVPVYVAPAVVTQPAALASPPPPPEPQPSRVTKTNGRYAVELHSLEVGPALSMLSEATRTTVTGSDVVAASSARITTSFVAATPLDVWKGVFGDIASFAMTCGPAGCAVRFVSLVAQGSVAALSTRPSVAPPPSPAPPGSPPALDSNGEPMPDN